MGIIRPNSPSWYKPPSFAAAGLLPVSNRAFFAAKVMLALLVVLASMLLAEFKGLQPAPQKCKGYPAPEYGSLRK